MHCYHCILVNNYNSTAKLKKLLHTLKTNTKKYCNYKNRTKYMYSYYLLTIQNMETLHHDSNNIFHQNIIC